MTSQHDTHLKFGRRKVEADARKRLKPSHEIFCQAYALSGECYGAGVDAYRKAYPAARAYSKQRVAELASGLLRRKKIKSRIEELRRGAAEIAERKLGISQEKVLQATAAIAFSSLEHFIDFDEHGNLNLNVEQADATAIRGLQFIRITGKSGSAAENVGAIELKLPDRLPALCALLKIFGPSTPPKSGSPPPSLDAQLQIAIERCKKLKKENR